MQLILIGFKASGKTTVGRLLAKDLAYSFIDSDEALCQSHGISTISALYQNVGENQFRVLEHLQLTSMLRPVSSVFSTGGGVVENQQNLGLLNQFDQVIFLDTSLQQIKNRLPDYQDLPLFKHQSLDALYEYRLGLYRKHARYIVNTDDKTPPQIVDEIKLSLGLSNGE